MAYQLNNGHPVFELRNQVAEYSKDFFRQHRLNYFQVLRCYPDGTFGALLNRTDLFEYFLKSEYSILSSYQEDAHGKSQSYVFIWDEELPSYGPDLARQHCGMYHGMTLVSRHRDYYDMIGFSMSDERSNAASYYLSHLSSFKNFADSFVSRYSDLMLTLDKNRVRPPGHMLDSNREKMCLPPGTRRYPLRGRDGQTYVTSQELFCMQLWERGKSYKEIADQISISARTVETYLSRARQRTGYSNCERILQALSP